MNRQMLFTLLSLLLIVTATMGMALPAAAQVDPSTCPLGRAVYWSPTAQGNDANDGLSAERSVRSEGRAKAVAAMGGGCIYLVIGPTLTDTGMQIQSSTTASGHPLAESVAYGLLLLLAASLIVGGIWTRRRAVQLQVSV